MNINDTVKVRLTPEALRIHRRNYDRFWYQRAPLVPYKAPEQVGGWSTFQLWDLMREFGHVMYQGGPQLFVDNEVQICELPK